MRERSRDEILAEHEQQLEELKNNRAQSYLSDGILGTIDGVVTTFAIVTGTVGGGLSGGAIILLGSASLIADGFSMALSNYAGTKSESDRLDNIRSMIRHHNKEIPSEARQQIEYIYRNKGFESDVLEEFVETITTDETLWEESLVQER